MSAQHIIIVRPSSAAAFLAAIVLAMCGAGLTASADEQDQPKADQDAAARDREIGELVALLARNNSYYALFRDTKEKDAIARLQKMAEHAAPAIAPMLAEGHENRKKGWFQVYRPLFILKRMGEHAKVALSNVIRALDDEHGINVTAAADILANIGTPAKDAAPALVRAWQRGEYAGVTGPGVKRSLAAALHRVDPEAAEKAGIPEPALLEQAQRAYDRGQVEEAIKLAGQAIAADKSSPHGYNFRVRMYEELGRHQEAVDDLTAALKLDPQGADLFNRRGSMQFKLGRIPESIADFDKFIALRPEQERVHWMRGIAYYYAGRYAEGAKHFAAYQAVNDAEYAVWHFLCMARDSGVPMMQVYALYRGDLKPEDVLAAAQAGAPSPQELNSRLFYAHLYLGLYYEATGEPKLALAHIAKAADEHKVGHYLWDVARVHAELLKKPKP